MRGGRQLRVVGARGRCGRVRRGPVAAGRRHPAPVHGAQQAAQDVARVARAPAASALYVIFTCRMRIKTIIINQITYKRPRRPHTTKAANKRAVHLVLSGYRSLYTILHKQNRKLDTTPDLPRELWVPYSPIENNSALE